MWVHDLKPCRHRFRRKPWLEIGENTPISSSEISAKSFSIAVLRNTQLPPDEIEARIDKIANMYSNETVSFEEFLNFNKFLQGLDDFAIALRFMEKGKFKIGPKELAQAVKITIDVELPELITNIMYSRVPQKKILFENSRFPLGMSCYV